MKDSATHVINRTVIRSIAPAVCLLVGLSCTAEQSPESLDASEPEERTDGPASVDPCQDITCPVGATCEPLEESCQVTGCGPGYELRGDQCIVPDPCEDGSCGDVNCPPTELGACEKSECRADRDEPELVFCTIGDVLGVQERACVGDRWQNSETCEAVHSLSAGWFHTCALRIDGQAVCWGANWYGQLGDGSLSDSSVPIGVTDVGGSGHLRDVTSISAGAYHTCALLQSGRAVCWGANWNGQLGNDSGIDSPTPVEVTGSGTADLDDAMVISAGEDHTCAIRGDGQVLCWGDNSYGQLGNGDHDFEGSNVPQKVGGLEEASALSAGRRYTCAIRSSGQAFCWGDNAYGQLGNGDHDFEGSNVPTEVMGLDDAMAISAGSRHTCAIRSSGQALCWGANWEGQLGSEHVNSLESSIPVAVTNLDDASTISVGGFHTCAIRSGGQALCWGANWEGQLGDGSNQGSHVPREVRGLSGDGKLESVNLISTGGYHTCAIRNGGQALCWGYNGEGQLGNRNSGVDSNIPLLLVPSQ